MINRVLPHMPLTDRVTAGPRSPVVVDDPLVSAKLSILRIKATPAAQFRKTLGELSVLLLMEAAQSWETTSREIETPLQKSLGRFLVRPVAFVPILRAGLGMLDGMLQVLPDAAVGHIGMYRNEETLQPTTYFVRLPGGLNQMQTVLLDPMLATGNSACRAVSLLKDHGAERIQLICAISCLPGIERLQSAHPDVGIVTAAIDPELNDFGFIVPGLGDAGDRCFGTT
jgi:uracil phosphoribosyltransferase